MIRRGCLAFSLMLNYAVLSLPIAPVPMDKKDVKVMKCIVEVIADALSIPQPAPVSQECLDTLRRDERLISILRHQNFLKELQEIAAQGATERANLKNIAEVGHMTNTTGVSLGSKELADQSMLLALRAPAKKRDAMLEAKKMFGNREFEEANEIGGEHEDQENGQDEDRRNSVSLNQEEEKPWPEQRGKTFSSEEDEANQISNTVAEDNAQADTGSNLVSRQKAESKVGKYAEEEEKEVAEKEEAERRSPEAVRTEGERDEEEPDVEEEVKHWNKMDELTDTSWEKHGGRDDVSTAGEQSVPLDPPHHSKEDSGEQVQELQMMAGREPTERREEDGSGSRKAEDHELESLAAIESELESVAQKLHEIRRG